MEITKTDPELLHHRNLIKLLAYRGIHVEPFEDFEKKKVFHWQVDDYDIFHIKKSAEANKTNEFSKLSAKCKGKIIVFSCREKPIEGVESINSEIALARDFGEFWAANGISIRIIPNLGELARFHVDREDLPHIHVSCTECIWLGASVGDIIESTRATIGPSNVTGDYRLVVDTPFKKKK